MGAIVCIRRWLSKPESRGKRDGERCHQCRPRIVYPYHYRDQGGTTTNAAYFKKALGTDLGIEVRLRKWY